MWLLCLLLKFIDNHVNKRWGLLGALKRFYSWTFPPLSLFDHCQIILKSIYTNVAYGPTYGIWFLVAIHLWTKCCWVFFGDKTLCLVYRSIYLIYYYQFVHNSINAIACILVVRYVRMSAYVPGLNSYLHTNNVIFNKTSMRV